MKKVITAALLLALSYAPSIARAEMTGARPAAVGGSSSGRTAEAAPVNIAVGGADYAAREAASPALAAFQGGHTGIYIGGGAVTVLLLVLIILIIL
jgi:hypothetical protein